MNVRSHKVLIPVLLFMCAFAGPAHAHRLSLFADYVGGKIRGTVVWGDGSSAVNLPVTIARGESHIVATVTTDGNGEFVFSPDEPGEFLLTCRTDDGHLASLIVGTGLTDAAPASQEALQEQIFELREQLAAFERRVGLRDIVGGVGYILGLAGLAALIKTRRK
jgi:nickel transport protein